MRDYTWIVFFAILPLNQTMNSHLYIKQLTNMNNSTENYHYKQTEEVFWSIITAKATYVFPHSEKIIGARLECIAISTK